MSVELLNVLPDETTAARLERHLRESIVGLELVPGSRLSEQEIAGRYGVSRQPVREALIALARSRLVEIRPSRGTVVAPISIEKMREARFIRETLETAVVRQAAGHFDPWTRERIAVNLEDQRDVLKAADQQRFRQLDGDFHILIAKGAGFAMAWSAIADMKAHMDRVCNLTLEYPHARDVLLEQHYAIVDAIDHNDPDAAEATMREHLQLILKALHKVKAERPELFV